MNSDFFKKIFKKQKAGPLLLVQCPPWDTQMPPLGIAYLSSHLKKCGYKVSVFDLNIELYHLAEEGLKSLWDQKSYEFWVDDKLFNRVWLALKEKTFRYFNRVLKSGDVKYIGLSVNFSGIKFTSELIKLIKDLKPDLKIILGGWGCINEHMRSLFPKDSVDIFVVGEGEEALTKAIDALEAKTKIDNILSRPPIKDLDGIAWPTFEDFNLSKYSGNCLPLFTSRGCISRCSFCNDWRMSSPYRNRSAENVFNEIRYHLSNNHVNTFSFKDLLCNGNIARLERLSNLIIGSGKKLNWDSQAIPLKEMNSDLLVKLKKSGCTALIYGVETFSNNVLKKMRKLFTKEAAEEVLKNTHNAGIKAMINIIVGFPGETEKDFEETLEAIEINRKFISAIGAVSVCLVNNDSDLNVRSQDYGLVLPADLRVSAKEWMSSDGENNYSVRRQRADKTIELINRLGLTYATATI